ncbi:MAG: aminoacyl-tRNA hydrolase [Synechococcales cyanobacterium RU_4_20]|nr:aminoacyl-tRNA hydrolase [Synechococcales cyanobacterium RU_4_20]NJR70272.1 aminoacyl-tRNA hydrolase [Synechococcales cyanobacterium CRU_2_2]
MPETTPVKPKLIVGLGNPGTKYDGTRHNIGFEAIDALSRRWSIDLADTKKFKGYFGEGPVPRAGKMRLLKPTTYMNLSGQAIRSVLDWYKLEPESVLIIYDDMDLPTGRLRLRLSGSAGGHNGMKSAIAHLSSQDFPRLRIGIGSPREGDRKGETISHVLGRFAPEERPQITKVLKLVVEATEMALDQGFEKAMSLYNTKAVVSG